MSKVRDEGMQISERELRAATQEMDDMHRALLPQMQSAASEFRDGLIERHGDSFFKAVSRRNVLIGGVAGLGALLLAACGSDGSSTTSTTAAGERGLQGDLSVAALAASVENLAVGTYQAGLDAATAGKLGSVPAAVATFITTAQQQHKDHAAAWNAVLSGAGKESVSGVDLTVKSSIVDPEFAKVTDVLGLARLALKLENSAAATYQAGIGVLSDKQAIKTAASIQPVEMQHAAILNFILGEYPVPEAFSKTEGARTASDQIG